jgi:hypothetical protein
MDKQKEFGAYEQTTFKKLTRVQKLLAVMNQVVPWKAQSK